MCGCALGKILWEVSFGSYVIRLHHCGVAFEADFLGDGHSLTAVSEAACLDAG